MKQYSIDVLIYLNKIKKLFESRSDVKEYFLTGIDKDMFFEQVCEISEKNLKDRGETLLTQEQLEAIRIELGGKSKDSKSFKLIFSLN